MSGNKVLLVTGGSRGIGAAILNFLSNKASCVTGAILTVSGGR